MDANARTKEATLSFKDAPLKRRPVPAMLSHPGALSVVVRTVAGPCLLQLCITAAHAVCWNLDRGPNLDSRPHGTLTSRATTVQARKLEYSHPPT